MNGKLNPQPLSESLALHLILELSSDDSIVTSIQKCSLPVLRGRLLLPLWASQGRHVTGFVVPFTVLFFNVEHQIPLAPCTIVSILLTSRVLCEAHILAVMWLSSARILMVAYCYLKKKHTKLISVACMLLL